MRRAASLKTSNRKSCPHRRPISALRATRFLGSGCGLSLDNFIQGLSFLFVISTFLFLGAPDQTYPKLLASAFSV